MRRGFRDGTAGFLISSLNSYYVFLKILKLWELQNGYRPADNGASGAGNVRRRPKFARVPNVEDRGLSRADAESPAPSIARTPQ